MGLIDRAEQDQLARFMRDGEERLQREREERELECRRIEVITHHLEVVASKLDEPLAPITENPVGLPRYYVLGDVVIMVKRFMHSEGKKPDPTRPAVMTFAYCTYLMALDADKKLRQRKIGTLKLLSFEGIAQAINDAPPGFNFNAQAVSLYVPQ